MAEDVGLHIQSFIIKNSLPICRYFHDIMSQPICGRTSLTERDARLAIEEDEWIIVDPAVGGRHGFRGVELELARIVEVEKNVAAT